MKKTLSQANKDLDLRRFGKDVYSKALGEGGGGEITADDITPELLLEDDIKAKIRRWGFTEEEIQDLPLLSELRVLDESGQEEDLKYYYVYLSARLTGIGLIDYDSERFELRKIGTNNFKYIKYAIDDNPSVTPVVLYREHYDEQGLAEYVDFSGSFSVVIKPDCLEVYMGVDTI